MGKQRLLITGASGIIGRHILAKLNSDNYAIQFLVLNEKEGVSLRSDFNLPTAQLAIIQDCFPSQEIETFKPEIVLHLAGYTTTSFDTKEVEKLLSANVHVGTQLLSALEKYPPVHFINVGTCMEYHDNSENLKSSNLYAGTKTAFRSILSYFHSRMEFSLHQCNLYFVYGMRAARKKVLDYIIESIDAKEETDMSPGLQELDFIHIDDVSDFFISLLQNLKQNTSPKNEFFVGSGKANSIQDAARTIEEIIEKPLLLNWGGLSYRKGDMMYSQAPIEKNPSFINWQPKVSLKEGLKKYIAR